MQNRLEAIIPSRSNFHSELTTIINTENNSLLFLNERNTLISALCTLFTIAICTCEIGSLPLTMADFGVVFLGVWFIFACLMLTPSWEAPNKPTLDYIQNNPIYGVLRVVMELVCSFYFIIWPHYGSTFEWYLHCIIIIITIIITMEPV